MPIMFILGCVFLLISGFVWYGAFLYASKADNKVATAKRLYAFNEEMTKLYKGYLDQVQHLHDEASYILEYNKELNEKWLAAKEQFEAKYNVQVKQVIDPITNEISIRILSM